jgi:hypothetical protein
VRPSAFAVLRLMLKPNFVACMDRQVGGLFTCENATRVKSDLSVFLYQARSVTHESARHHELGNLGTWSESHGVPRVQRCAQSGC